MNSLKDYFEIKDLAEDAMGHPERRGGEVREALAKLKLMKGAAPFVVELGAVFTPTSYEQTQFLCMFCSLEADTREPVARVDALLLYKNFFKNICHATKKSSLLLSVRKSVLCVQNLND